MKTVTELRSWQIEAIQIGRSAKHLLLQAPGGAGKSLTQVMLAQADIEDTGNKQLILVPKNHIHHGFFDEEAIEFVLPGASEVSRWEVDSNFCTRSDHKTKLLKDFLLADVRDLRKQSQLAAIATHKAMASVWETMTKTEKEQALRNISFTIDEAHHLSNVFHDFDLELFNRKDRVTIQETATKLGNFVNYVLRHNDPSVQVRLATATYFRGDQQTILSQRFKTEFSHYCLTWEEHFPTLGIEHLGVDFVAYAGNPIDLVVKLVEKEPDERHLIIIPALTHRWRTPKSLSHLMERLLKVIPEQEVLDLVTESTQDEHKRLLQSHPEKFRAVIACRLFDEGTDWVPCTRMHNTDACENSLTLAVQRFYRPLRYHPAKKVVQIFNYVPMLDKNMSQEEQRQVVSDRLNSVLACVVTQGEISPILVNVKSDTVNQTRRLSLQEVLGEDYPVIIRKMLKQYECLEDKHDRQQVSAIADKVLTEFELPTFVEHEAVRSALLSQLCRIACPKNNFTPDKLRTNGIDAETIRQKGFDKVWPRLMPAQSLVCFGAENIDLTTIRELLRIVKELPLLEEIHDGIRAFHQRTGNRPTFHQAEWMDELDRSASAVDKILRRNYESTLANEVRAVLGDFNDDLLTKTHDLIRDYWSQGIRIGNKYGNLPEIDMTSYALNGRLWWNYKTTLAAEVEKILGPQTKPLTIPKVRQVIREYLKRGRRLTRKFGPIPELEMSSFNLSDRLKRNFDMSLSELVDQVAKELAT